MADQNTSEPDLTDIIPVTVYVPRAWRPQLEEAVAEVGGVTEHDREREQAARLAMFGHLLREFRLFADPGPDGEFHAACRYLFEVWQRWQAGAEPLPEGTLIPMGVRLPAPDPDIPALEAVATFAAGQARRQGGPEWEEVTRQLATILNRARMASEPGTAAAAIRKHQARGAGFLARLFGVRAS